MSIKPAAQDPTSQLIYYLFHPDLIPMIPNSLSFSGENVMLIWRFSRDLYNLIEEFFYAVNHCDFIGSFQIIQHFHFIWIESERLHLHFGKVEEQAGLILSSLIIHSLAAQLAWITHGVSCVHNDFAMIALCVGIKLYAPLLAYGSFFQTYTLKKRVYRSRRNRLQI